MGIPWETSHGMGRDRHKLLWDGNGTDKYFPWTTLTIAQIYCTRASLEMQLLVLVTVFLKCLNFMF